MKVHLAQLPHDPLINEHSRAIGAARDRVPAPVNSSAVDIDLTDAPVTFVDDPLDDRVTVGDIAHPSCPDISAHLVRAVFPKDTVTELALNLQRRAVPEGQYTIHGHGGYTLAEYQRWLLTGKVPHISEREYEQSWSAQCDPPVQRTRAAELRRDRLTELRAWIMGEYVDNVKFDASPPLVLAGVVRKG